MTFTPSALALHKAKNESTTARSKVQSNAPLKNDNAVTGRNVVRDLRSEALVVHQEELNLLDVVDDELLESVR